MKWNLHRIITPRPLRNFTYFVRFKLIQAIFSKSKQKSCACLIASELIELTGYFQEKNTKNCLYLKLFEFSYTGDAVFSMPMFPLLPCTSTFCKLFTAIFISLFLEVTTYRKSIYCTGRFFATRHDKNTYTRTWRFLINQVCCIQNNTIYKLSTDIQFLQI